ncbi:MAG TPA: DUF5071 domain-containing protein [Spirochaetota bacterium]|nr:DUF5071 domain-containing protein [Spirochaetota bacterium]HPJ43323.1 DUF5071 domain-containing protein [Spirochaetota bacterium]
MMYWLRDMNWPGADIIFNIFLGVEEDDLLPVIERALLNAERENDTVWICWLNRLIERKEISDKLSERFQLIMKKEDR